MRLATAARPLAAPAGAVLLRRLAACGREGLVALGRGTVTITDCQGLRARADGG